MFSAFQYDCPLVQAFLWQCHVSCLLFSVREQMQKAAWKLWVNSVASMRISWDIVNAGWSPQVVGQKDWFPSSFVHKAGQSWMRWRNYGWDVCSRTLYNVTGKEESHSRDKGARAVRKGTAQSFTVDTVSCLGRTLGCGSIVVGNVVTSREKKLWCAPQGL